MQTCHSRGFGRLSRGLLIVLTFALPAACGIEDVIIEPPGDPGDPGGPENPQSIYYDLATFATEIQPVLDVAGCTTVGCHDSDDSAIPRGVPLFRGPAPGSNEMWFNLQTLTSFVQLDTFPAPFSAEDTGLFVRAVDRHRGVAFDQPERLAAWLEDAAARFDSPQARFDMDVFVSDIQPVLDAGCSLAGCHDVDTVSAGFGLYRSPAPDSTELLENLRAVAERVDFSYERAEETWLFVRATDRHRGAALDSDEMILLQQWIQAALDAHGAE